MKDFDIKQFLLRKGERIGLGVAAAVMVLLVASGGMTTFKSENPNDVAQDLKDKARAVDSRIKFGENTSSPDLKRELTQPVVAALLGPDNYPVHLPFFDRKGTLEDNKRRNPDVLWPTEFQVDYLRAPVEFHDVIIDGGKMRIGVLVPKDAAPVMNKAVRKTQRELMIERQIAMIQEILKARAAAMGFNPNANLAASIANQDPNAPVKLDLKHVPVDEVDGEKDKLAKVMYPVRMVVVSAAFPYKEQLEVFRRVLRYATIDDLVKDADSLPQFIGVQVQRRSVQSGQRDDEGWEEVDVKEDIRWATYRWILSRAVGTVKEDPRMESLIFNRLMVMPRPQLGRNEQYPPVTLKAITQTLAALDKTKTKVELKTSPLNRKLAGDRDIFDIGEEAKPDPQKPVAPPPTTGTKKEPVVIPDYCLMRFLDVTVQPGETYEYRLRLKLTNPNFGKKELVAYQYLAEVREIDGPWKVVTHPDGKPWRVELPGEHFFYVVDDKAPYAYARDRINVQVHRWLETARLNPAQRDTDVAIADWAIADMPAYRGEFIGRVVNHTPVLMWYPTRETFDLAINPVSMRVPRGAVIPKGIPVDFTTRHLLVDFDGGKGVRQPYRFDNKVTKDLIDDSSMELLIMNPDGKLVVRYSHDDIANDERQARYDRAREQVRAAQEKANQPAFTKPNIFQAK